MKIYRRLTSNQTLKYFVSDCLKAKKETEIKTVKSESYGFTIGTYIIRGDIK